MLNANDKETLVKSSQTANLLVQDLRDQVKAANPLLAEIAIEILQQARRSCSRFFCSCQSCSRRSRCCGCHSRRYSAQRSRRGLLYA